MAFNRFVLHFYFYFKDVFEDDFGHLCFFISVANPTHNPHTHTHPHTQQAGESRSLLHMQKEGTFFIHFQVSTKTRKLNLSLTLFQNWWLFLCLILFSCCRFFLGSFNSEPPFYSLFSCVSIYLFLSHTGTNIKPFCCCWITIYRAFESLFYLCLLVSFRWVFLLFFSWNNSGFVEAQVSISVHSWNCQQQRYICHFEFLFGNLVKYL
jgi:hypothetical protein